jgi:glutamate dehydrogenase
MIEAYRAPADALRGLGAEVLSTFEHETVERRIANYVALGAPEALAREVAVLRPLTATTDIADLAAAARRTVPAAARLYHQTGAVFGFDRLRYAAGGVARGDHFERLAVRRLIEDMLAEQRALTEAVISSAPPHAGDSNESARAAVEGWISGREAQARRALRNVEEVEASGGGWSFAKLTIANAALRELAA